MRGLLDQVRSGDNDGRQCIAAITGENISLLKPDRRCAARFRQHIAAIARFEQPEAAAGKRKTMFRWFAHLLPYRVGGLVASRYRPERHYMRGFGPACAARRATQPSLRQTV